MKIYTSLIFILFLTVVFPLNAAQPLSLKQAIQTALAANSDLKGTRIALQAARITKKITRSLLYPSLNIYGNYKYFSAVPSIELPIPSLDSVTLGENNNYKLGIRANYLLWAGGRISGLAFIDNLKVQMLKQNLEASRRLVIHTTRLLYYHSLYLKDLIRLVQENLKLVRDRVTSTSNSFKAGSASRLTLREVEVSAAEADVRLLDTKSKFRISLLRLRNYLNLPVNRQIFLTSTLNREYKIILSRTLHPGTGTRAVEKSLLLRIRAARKSIDLARTGYLPSVSISTGFEYGRPHLNQPGKWGGNFMIGVGINFNLFSGYSTVNRIKKAKINVQKLENALTKLRRTTRFEKSDTLLRLITLKKTIQAKHKNLLRAKDNFRASNIAFKSGSMSLLELNTRELTMRNIENRYYLAIYQFLATYSNLKRINY